MTVLNNIEIKSIEDAIDVGAWCYTEGTRLIDEANHAKAIIREYNVDTESRKIFGRLWKATIAKLSPKRPRKFNQKRAIRFLNMAVKAGVITENQLARLFEPQEHRARAISFSPIGGKETIQ